MATEDRKPKNWIRDLLIIPLIVGLIVAFFTYLLPKLLDKGKQLSFSIDDTVTYLDTNTQELEGMNISVNDQPISNLYLYKIDIWNSGDLPLLDLSIRLVFNAEDNVLNLFTINHNTSPKFQFGNIDEQIIDNHTIIYTYELLNPDNEDEIVILADRSVPLDLYAKSEGVKIKRVEQRDFSIWLILGAGFLSTGASIMAIILKNSVDNYSTVIKLAKIIKETDSIGFG